MTTLYAINIPMTMRERETTPRRPTKTNFFLFTPSELVDIDDTEKMNTVLKHFNYPVYTFYYFDDITYILDIT